MPHRHHSPQEFWDDVHAHPERSQAEFWDDLYAAGPAGEREAEATFLLVETEGLVPGTALELGCGEGTDAIRLAQRGWHVLGVDIALTAIERARQRADELGLSRLARFEARDLARDFPSGSFDLVSAQFLHSPFAADGERAALLRNAAKATAPGGHLVVVSHAGPPSWSDAPPAGLSFPGPDENRAALAVAGGRWQTLRDEVVLSDVPDADGKPGTRPDHVLHMVRAA